MFQPFGQVFATLTSFGWIPRSNSNIGSKVFKRKQSLHLVTYNAIPLIPEGLSFLA
ncbi:MAG: hypothetical protein GF317_12210 [Candidatus Lokiarchaeota archaeon]|nr:hypothetical protein [Candidatus Lokiarchaeota archaeon]MBD3200411.1 hypothetical protein [Candidatus Lokiarchaeota archaeon]